MPILLSVLASNDQKVVEQGSLCVSRVVESFKYQQTKLEELISTDLLKAILRLLLPGTTNLIGPKIHTQFLRVLSITARASPSLATELFKMDVVDTIYQILTGVSPPSGSDDLASEIDGVVIMQALIHRPREQIYETLNVICELLPSVSTDGLSTEDALFDISYSTDERLPDIASKSKKSPNSRRIELLKGCRDKLRRFATILLPTLTHAYSSTVNLSVRQKVLIAQLKMLSNLDTSILVNALRSVPYASYLASILSQQDHPMLVTFALQAAELLLLRLESIYRYQFYREGVIAEVAKIANQPYKADESQPKAIKIEPEESAAKFDQSIIKTENQENMSEKVLESGHSEEDQVNDQDDEDEDEDDEDGIDEDDDDGGPDDVHGDGSPSPSTSSSSSERNYLVPPPMKNSQDYVVTRAKKFLETYENAQGIAMRNKATAILDEVQSLAKAIRNQYLGDRSEDSTALFIGLADYFSADALDSITSSELLNSGIIQVLLDVFNNPSEGSSSESKSTFLEVFMGTALKGQVKTRGNNTLTTPFGVLVHKLQDLLSRSEHFEVVTVHHNAFDSNRSSAASMLAKQLRLKLVADDDSEIPRPYRNIMVSIHAIATFKALDDYLRPRISLSDRPRGGRHHEGVSSALAAFAAAAGITNPHQRLTDRGLLNIAPPSLPTPSSAASTSKAPRKLSKTKAPGTSAASPVDPSKANEKPASIRRSNRRHQPSSQTPAETPQASEQAQSQLECADEKQMIDEDAIEDANALEAFVDDLEDEMDNGPVPDPTAVNMEVASTGKVTARQEDGTRVPTPSQGSVASLHGPPSSRTRAPQTTPSTPSQAGRPMSVPQDWHIEFSFDDKPIANETTVYRAVHYTGAQPDDLSTRNVWSAIHQIKFRKVSGPPPPESSPLSRSIEAAQNADPSGLPASLHKHPTTSAILRLLDILHELNANVDDVLDEKPRVIKISAEPLAQFVNTKLTAKLNRQLEEPLIVASNCLPSWSEDLARLYPFLFPFETRHLFLQSTSFGYSRSMTRWQNAQSTEDTRRDRHRDDRPFLGRLQRQKVRISRTRILESAVKVMELYGASPSVLEVEYFEEVGTGLGPTLEFYSTVSKEFSKKKIKLWRENESSESEEFAFGKLGMFPAPMSDQQADSENGQKILHLFKMLGKFVARSMLDSRIIDVSFNPTFFRIGDRTGTIPLSLAAVRTVDAGLAQSLRIVKQFASARKMIEDSGKFTAEQKVAAARELQIDGCHIEDLGLDFTLPGYPSIELIDNGSNIPVTMENVGNYIEKVIDMTLGSGIQRQVDAFRAGFSQVFPYSALKAFTPGELVMLFGRVEEDWSIESKSTLLH